MKPESQVEFSFRQLLPTIAFDILMPVVMFFVLRSYGFSTLLSLVAGGAFPALNVARTWIASRRIQPLGIIVLTFLVVGTAASLVSGSVFFTQVKESILTAGFGILCLGSLVAGERPLMFYILRQFIAGGDALRLQWWENLWQHPLFRAAQRRVTLVWGGAYLIDALTRLVLACLLAPAQVVVLSPMISLSVTIALVTWTRRYLVALRERHA